MYNSRLPAITAELLPRLETVAAASAELIASKAKQRVPVDTGKLRDAIHVQKTGVGEYSVIAGDNGVFYGHIVEHGGGRTPPRPFMTPALEDSRGEINALAIEALRGL